MKVLSSIVKIGVPLLLGGAILWWMYRGFEWETISEAITSDMDWTWMWLSLPFGVLAQVFRALRWQQLLRPLNYKVRTRTSINAIFLSYASSLVVPRAGEVLRCGVLKRYEGAGFSKGLGTVVTERIIDMLMIAVLSFIVVLTQVPTFAAFFAETGASFEGFFARFSTTGYLVTALCVMVIIAMLTWFMHHFQFFSKTRALLRKLLQGILSVRHLQGYGIFILYSLGIWVCYFLHFYLTFFCFSETAPLGLVAAMVAFVVGTFAVIVPTPNGAGPWHFAVKTILVLFGVSGDLAAIYVLVVHTVQTALVAVLGLYSLVALGLTSKRNSSENSI